MEIYDNNYMIECKISESTNWQFLMEIDVEKNCVFFESLFGDFIENPTKGLPEDVNDETNWRCGAWDNKDVTWLTLHEIEEVIEKIKQHQEEYCPSLAIRIILAIMKELQTDYESRLICWFN